MNVIETVGLTKTYGSRHAVDNLDLTVRRGEIYGFVGRNGAGKSTVMKMIAGLELPTSGEVSLFGERQAPGVTSRRLGALIENPGIIADLSGFDNVMCRAIAQHAVTRHHAFELVEHVRAHEHRDRTVAGKRCDQIAHRAHALRVEAVERLVEQQHVCLLYTSPSPRD